VVKVVEILTEAGQIHLDNQVEMVDQPLLLILSHLGLLHQVAQVLVVAIIITAMALVVKMVHQDQIIHLQIELVIHLATLAEAAEVDMEEQAQV
jgi:hypothetical protein